MEGSKTPKFRQLCLSVCLTVCSSGTSWSSRQTFLSQLVATVMICNYPKRYMFLLFSINLLAPSFCLQQRLVLFIFVFACSIIIGIGIDSDSNTDTTDKLTRQKVKLFELYDVFSRLCPNRPCHWSSICMYASGFKWLSLVV